ncbi:hypothetical protein KAFR_0A07610 [Kazachstania africana CBS 2517]|uniref:Uncharacterized protein n=1 Tax=Kazachstania africana (strain ATCC 22294 / BCRC 22015 / CBS 2517 / CECT 1963 / NBRC 1671 / NRRL Y-8276) TaxID=1071382 RepID=H2AP95_KAZAF|nr:hypothetical protein KAFR_0A07610 [Kazachstania africana CBS 2517]CCF56195.1 hypothetical protein KAFR_0A07610 [Kazachstania africana CBS 2517]
MNSRNASNFNKKSSEARLNKIERLYNERKNKQMNDYENKSTTLGNNTVKVEDQDEFYDADLEEHSQNWSGDLLNQDDVTESNYYPTLISPDTIAAMRGYRDEEHNDSQRKVGQNSNTINIRKNRRDNSQGRRHYSVRNVLGDPLPLPYINNGNEKDSEKPKSVITKDRLLQKKNEMNNKWRRLLTQDKVMIERRLQELRKLENVPSVEKWIDPSKNPYIPKHDEAEHSLHNSSAINHDEQSDNATHHRAFSIDSISKYHSPSQFSTGVDSYTSQTLLRLQEDIEENKRKLDIIINLLRGQQSTTNDNDKSISREILYWTICIIILFICNIYVYYYM